MKEIPGNPPAPPVSESGHVDSPGVAKRRDDAASLSAFQAAAKAIFVKANGLQAYYRTFYRPEENSEAVTASRKGDRRQMVWRARVLAGVVP